MHGVNGDNAGARNNAALRIPKWAHNNRTPDGAAVAATRKMATTRRAGRRGAHAVRERYDDAQLGACSNNPLKPAKRQHPNRAIPLDAAQKAGAR